MSCVSCGEDRMHCACNTCDVCGDPEYFLDGVFRPEESEAFVDATKEPWNLPGLLVVHRSCADWVADATSAISDSDSSLDMDE